MSALWKCVSSGRRCPTPALADFHFFPRPPDRWVGISIRGLLLSLGTQPVGPPPDDCRRHAGLIRDDNEYFPIITEALDRVDSDVLTQAQLPIRIAGDRVEDVSDHAILRPPLPADCAPYPHGTLPTSKCRRRSYS